MRSINISKIKKASIVATVGLVGGSALFATSVNSEVVDNLNSSSILGNNNVPQFIFHLNFTGVEKDEILNGTAPQPGSKLLNNAPSSWRMFGYDGDSDNDNFNESSDLIVIDDGKIRADADELDKFKINLSNMGNILHDNNGNFKENLDISNWSKQVPNGWDLYVKDDNNDNTFDANTDTIAVKINDTTCLVLAGKNNDSICINDYKFNGNELSFGDVVVYFYDNNESDGNYNSSVDAIWIDDGNIKFDKDYDLVIAGNESEKEDKTLENLSSNTLWNNVKFYDGNNSDEDYNKLTDAVILSSDNYYLDRIEKIIIEDNSNIKRPSDVNKGEAYKLFLSDKENCSNKVADFSFESNTNKWKLNNTVSLTSNDNENNYYICFDKNSKKVEVDVNLKLSSVALATNSNININDKQIQFKFDNLEPSFENPENYLAKNGKFNYNELNEISIKVKDFNIDKIKAAVKFVYINASNEEVTKYYNKSENKLVDNKTFIEGSCNSNNNGQSTCNLQLGLDYNKIKTLIGENSSLKRIEIEYKVYDKANNEVDANTILIPLEEVKVIEPRVVKIKVGDSEDIEKDEVIVGNLKGEVLEKNESNGEILLKYSRTPLKSETIRLNKFDPNVNKYYSFLGDDNSYTIKNAADYVYVINKNDLIEGYAYIAFDGEIDPKYTIFQKALKQEIGIEGLEHKYSILSSIKYNVPINWTKELGNNTFELNVTKLVYSNSYIDITEEVEKGTIKAYNSTNLEIKLKLKDNITNFDESKLKYFKGYFIKDDEKWEIWLHKLDDNDVIKSYNKSTKELTFIVPVPSKSGESGDEYFYCNSSCNREYKVFKIKNITIKDAGAILKYLGKWEGVKLNNNGFEFGRILMGYAVKPVIDPNNNNLIIKVRGKTEEKGYIVIPVKYKDNPEHTVINLKEGWNLIGILTNTNPGNIGEFTGNINIASTTLNNLRSNGNLIFTLFVPPVLANPIGINPTDTQISLPQGVKLREDKAYWIMVPGVGDKGFNYYSNFIPKPKSN